MKWSTVFGLIVLLWYVPFSLAAVVSLILLLAANTGLITSNIPSSICLGIYFVGTGIMALFAGRNARRNEG